MELKKLLEWLGMPGKIVGVAAALIAAVILFGKQWDGFTERTELVAQEAARAEAEEVVREETKAFADQQAEVVQQLEGLNENVRVLIDQDARAACREIGPMQIPFPDNWDDLTDRQQYAVCERESRYRRALWDCEDDPECEVPPEPEEVP
jgi:hypothetical protein